MVIASAVLSENIFVHASLHLSHHGCVCILMLPLAIGGHCTSRKCFIGRRMYWFSVIIEHYHLVRQVEECSTDR